MDEVKYANEDTDDAKKGLAESGETKVASKGDLAVTNKALNEDVQLNEVTTGADSLDQFASPHNPSLVDSSMPLSARLLEPPLQSLHAVHSNEQNAECGPASASKTLDSLMNTLNGMIPVVMNGAAGSDALGGPMTATDENAEVFDILGTGKTGVNATQNSDADSGDDGHPHPRRVDARP